ncbi:9136_t:CDS:10, partial [Acaulospora colombiana]
MSNGTRGREPAKPAQSLSLDLSHHIKGCYRLIKLVVDDGLGDSGEPESKVPERNVLTCLAVQKTIVDQESIRRYIDVVSPGSYRSTSRIDFNGLDKLTMKPRGVYGSISSLVTFLLNIDSIDSEIASLLCEPRDESSGITRPVLSTGIYLLDGRHIKDDLSFIIFWPEDDIWDDEAELEASDNRTIFMRYLQKLSDQLICLISDEDAANLALEGNQTSNTIAGTHTNGDINSDKGSTNAFEEAEPDHKAGPIYETISIKHLISTQPNSSPPGYPSHLPSYLLDPRIVGGEAVHGILLTSYLAEAFLFLNEQLTRFNSGKQGYQVDIDESIDEQSITILMQMDFVKARCGDLESRWKAYKEKLKSNLEASYASNLGDRMAGVHGIERALTVWMIYKVSEFHPGWVLGDLLRRVSNSEDTPVDLESARARIEVLFNDYYDIKLEALAELKIRINQLEQDQERAYNNSKSSLKHQVNLVDEKTIEATSEDSLTLSDSCFRILVRRTMAPFKALKALFCPVAGSKGIEGTPGGTTRKQSSTNARGLRKLLGRTEKRKQQIFDDKRSNPSLIDSLWTIILEQSERTGQRLKDALRRRYEEELKRVFNKEVKQNEVQVTQTLPRPTIRIKRIQISPQDDLVFNEGSSKSFERCQSKSKSSSSRYQPSGHLAVHSSARYYVTFKAALDFTKNIGSSIGRYVSKKAFYVEEPGQQANFAIDESSCSLALLSRSDTSLQLHRFKYDVDNATLSPYGSPADLTRWYPRGVPKISELLFIGGPEEELLLVDESATFSRPLIALIYFGSTCLTIALGFNALAGIPLDK